MHTTSALFLTAGALAATQAKAVPHIDWVDCSQNVPAVLSSQWPDANLSALPDTLHCGQMLVPMRYDRPIDIDNNITINLAMFRPKKPKGVLFYCPGGTDAGAAVAWQVALGLNSDFTPNFGGLLDYDIMVMDIRGTWGSNPLNASLDIIGPLLGDYPDPSDRSAFDAYLSAASTMWQSWLNMSTPAGILDHVGTREVVQDYDLIRGALGYKRINFLGASTGSYRAAQYAATFPSRVHKFVLDAVVPHGMSMPDQVKYDLIAVNRGLDRADAYCQNNATCYWHHAGRGSVQKAYQDLVARAANDTLAACGTSDVANCTTFVPKWILQATISGLLQGQPDFPNVLEVLAAAHQGDVSIFLTSSTLTIDQVWGLPILCNDYPIVDKTLKGFQKVAKAGREVDRYDIDQSSWLGIQLIGSVWPYAVPPNPPLKLNSTMLLVTADFDISQATEKTTFVWEHQTPHAALVVRHGEDHVSFNNPTQASTRITKEFLRSGVLPLKEDSTFVTVYEPGQCRRPVADPYCVPTGFQAGDVDSL
ncbi:hypothetical protein LTR49_019472 [Elasticomyces elasticus]|nr:hypothetical protein LTR49_019472 [Elasticomyces elasticus]